MQRARLSATLFGRLAKQGVNTSAALAEYARFDLWHRELPGLVRSSVHYCNHNAELDRLIGALPAPRPRQRS
jgi:cysteine desulfurase / selenocysteine lyase